MLVHGFFVLTRQRSGAGSEAGPRACPRCEGTGTLVDPAEIALRVFRELRARAAADGGRPLRARVSGLVGEILHETRAGELAALEEETGGPIELAPDPALPAEGWAVEAGEEE